MTRRLLVLALLVYALPAQAGETWDKLWRNSEQRAEALLQHGDAKAAAGIYTDPQRRAYAKLQAGDFAGAADDLAKLHDGEADYNRGTALAHAGDLQGALAAYDAALKSDPNNHDAQHNRELVEKALKQSPPQQQKSGDKKSGNDKQDGQKNGEQKDSDQNKSGQGGKDQNGKDQNGKDQQSPTGKQNEQPGKEQDSKASGKQDQGKQQGRQNEKSANGASDKQPQSATQANQAGKKDAAKNDAEQARRDAEASLAKPVQQGKQGAGSDDELNGSKPAAMGENDKPKSEKPKSEKEIAQEQWLRSIPDDPGGLLRRKFLIEHMMRQQKAQQ